MQASEAIPAALHAPAMAAVAWLNAARGTEHELTGLVDSEDALAASPGEAFELGLVLCDGEICAREQVRVVPSEGTYHFDFVDAPALDIPPRLDPPPGMRSAWLDEQLGKFDFVLLLYYRGRW